jgi:Na+-transporting NADH:ubiquinone oxidoreductase subunit NqrF
MTAIVLGVAMFTGVILALVGLLLGARRRLVDRRRRHRDQRHDRRR